MPQPTRFVDDRTWLYDFADLFLVHCPRCDSMAKVIMKDKVDMSQMKDNQKYTTLIYSPRRLVCTNCGYVDDWAGSKIAFETDKDWFFERPLWLQTPCAGNLLWAFNSRHIDFLEHFVTARLRQGSRSNTHTLANTLPKWIQLARNRSEVLKGITKLRHSITGDE